MRVTVVVKGVRFDVVRNGLGPSFKAFHTVVVEGEVQVTGITSMKIPTLDPLDTEFIEIDAAPFLTEETRALLTERFLRAVESVLRGKLDA